MVACRTALTRRRYCLARCGPDPSLTLRFQRDLHWNGGHARVLLDIEHDDSARPPNIGLQPATARLMLSQHCGTQYGSRMQHEEEWTWTERERCS